jgi:hypothetical protein
MEALLAVFGIEVKASAENCAASGGQPAPEALVFIMQSIRAAALRMQPSEPSSKKRNRFLI